MVLFVAVALAVTNHIQPMAAPALAVGRRRQQSVHQFAVRVRRFVGQESGDFIRGGRQSGEVDAYAADQRAIVDRGGRRQSVLRQLAEEESVHDVFRQMVELGSRRLRLGQGLDGPERFVFFRSGAQPLARVGRPRCYPGTDDLDFSRSQLARGGHFPLDDGAEHAVLLEVVSRAQPDSQRGPAGGQIDVGCLLLCVVARDAALLQDGGSLFGQRILRGQHPAGRQQQASEQNGREEAISHITGTPRSLSVC